MAAVTAAVVGAAGMAYSANRANKAAAQQASALRDAQNINTQATAQARADANQLFNRGIASQNKGYGHSMDLLAGGMQPQADMMNQGNLNAQQTLINGGQGFMNSILGQGGNPYESMQPQQVTPDFSYLTDYIQQQRNDDLQAATANQPVQNPAMNITPFQSFQQAMQQGGGGLSSLLSYNPNQRLF